MVKSPGCWRRAEPGPLPAPPPPPSSSCFRVPGVRLHRNVQRFRDGLVFKAHRLCISLNSRLESNKEEEFQAFGKVGEFQAFGPGSDSAERLGLLSHDRELLVAL